MHALRSSGPVLPAVTVFAVLISTAALWAPASASASRAVVPNAAQWATADAAFVGTVLNVENNASWATVHVEDVWQGPDQPVEVVVRGGPGGDVVTSVDRTYTVGTRYLFAVTIADGELSDSACSGTTQADMIDLDALRPVDVRQAAGAAPESGGGSDLGVLGGPMLVVGVIGSLLLATVLVARRRDT